MTAAIIVLAYWLGSIPFGLLLTRMAGLGDIREIGSGNIGATNVMRTGRKGIGVATLLLDAGKGFTAVTVGKHFGLGDMAVVCGLLTVAGHIFPVWLKFKGGKGVATAIGVFFGVDWRLGAAVCVMWLLAFLLMRISSLAALLAIGYSPIVAYVLGNEAAMMMCLVVAATIVYTHRSNISRLLGGTEHTFKGKKP